MAESAALLVDEVFPKQPGRLQVLDDTRDRLTVQIAALDLKRRIRRDLLRGEDVCLDEPQQRKRLNGAVVSVAE